MGYDYLRAIIQDVKDAIPSYDYDDCYDLDDVRDQLHDDLWVDDSVTGNGSGSYTFSREEARGYVGDNMELLVDAIEEFGGDPQSYKRALTDPEYADVSIRCYLLGGAIDCALEDRSVQEYFANIFAKNGRSRSDNKKPATKRTPAKKTAARKLTKAPAKKTTTQRTVSRRS
jgi:hypothetical protein